MDRQGSKTPRREPREESDELARLVVDAALEVHAAIGPGYTEDVYENALCVELELRRVAFVRQPGSSSSTRGASSARAGWTCWSPTFSLWSLRRWPPLLPCTSSRCSRT